MSGGALTVFGLETEYVLNFVPARATAEPPTRETVYDALITAAGRRVRTAPARVRKPGTALENGGFLQYEYQMPAHREGVIEAATPECATVTDAVTWSAAQDRLLIEATPEAERILAQQGHEGRVVLGKNNFGVEGHAVGSHENYQVRDRAGVGGWLARLVGFPVLILPWLVFFATPWVIVLVVLACVFTAAGLTWVLRSLARWPLVRYGAEPLARAAARSVRRMEPYIEEIPLRLVAFLVYRVYRPFVPLYSWWFGLSAFRRLRSAVATHCATRIVFTGAGTLALDSAGCPAGFQLSQRADRLTGLLRVYWDEPGRPFIDVKALFFNPLAVFRRSKRLHLLAGDANMSQTAEFLRFGTTSLVLRLADGGHLADAPFVLNPVEAIRTISRDPTLRVRVPVRGGGRMTPCEIQRWFLERAATVFGAEGGETAEVLRRWRQVLERLERDAITAKRQVDWVMKREVMLHAAGGEQAFADIVRLRPVRVLIGAELDAAPDHADGAVLRDVVCAGRRPEHVERIEAVVAENFEGWEELAAACATAWRLRKADLRYHHGDLQGGYYFRLLGAGNMERVVADDRVARAMHDPPDGTRAAVRGRLVRRIAESRWDGWASWHKVRIRELRRVFHLGGPLDVRLGLLDSLPAPRSAEPLPHSAGPSAA